MSSTIPATTSEYLLHLRDFGAAFGEKVILNGLDLDVESKKITVLMGPSGTGKSTLLRTLAGLNNANPSFHTWGEAYFTGEPLSEVNKPSLVSQSAKLMMNTVLENIIQSLPERNNLTQTQQKELAIRLVEVADLHILKDQMNKPIVELPLALQRHIAILRLASAGPRLLCLDEPTTGIGEREVEKLLTHIQYEANKRGVLIVLHNQLQAKKLGGYVALLAGGRVQEANESSDFFNSPRTESAQQFVKSGSCSVPSPGAKAEDLDESVIAPPKLPPAAKRYTSETFGPRGFLWLLKGELAGTPLPGVFMDQDYDLRALQRVGVTHLVSIMEFAISQQALQKYGISRAHFFIEDMGVPSLPNAAAICLHIQRRIAASDIVAVHCRAGLGRTGTVLALYLIWKGSTAIAALERVRSIEPRWVQSQQQVDFLEAFFQYVERNISSSRHALSSDSKSRSHELPNAI